MTLLVDIDRLLFKTPVPAGMNPYVLMSLAYYYRGTTEHTTPITVRREGELFRILDGRHRVTASIMAGRQTVLAEIEPGNAEAATPGT